MGLWRLPLRLAAEGALPPLCLRQGPTGYLEQMKDRRHV
jgi:hypothetical protein